MKLQAAAFLFAFVAVIGSYIGADWWVAAHYGSRVELLLWVLIALAFIGGVVSATNGGWKFDSEGGC